MLAKSTFIGAATLVVTLSMSAIAKAQYAYHVGYTHYGPVTGLNHWGSTGAGGAYGGFHTSSAYHAGGYGGGYGGGYHYGGYHYGGYGGYRGGYHYGGGYHCGGYGGGVHYGGYRRW
jgi:hypothetical protein